MYGVLRTNDLPSLPEWRAGDTDSMKCSRKLALFDWDFTLVKRRSSSIFPQSREDLQWWHPNVPIRLRQLSASGTAIIIVSNQNNLLSGPAQRLDILESQILRVAHELQVPFHMYCSVREDLFRKPRTGIWGRIKQDYPYATCSKTYFVGDSAGREGDWSASDRKYALNIGVNFYTPKEFFLGQDRATLRIGLFDPKMSDWGGQSISNDGKLARALLEMPRVVLMVRPPEHEEAEAFRRYFTGIGHGVMTVQKNDVLPGALNGKWMIDTTEPSASARSALLRSLPVEKQDVGCLWLDRDMELVWHYRTWCLYRDWESRSKEEDHVDTDSLKAELRTWMDMLDFPHVAEGFSVIVKPSFKFFGPAEDYESWKQYWD